MGKISWKNNLDGLWSNAANWLEGMLPGAADDVTLATRPYHTITHSSGTDTIHRITATNDGLVFSGGSLTVLRTRPSRTETLSLTTGALYLDGSTASVLSTKNSR